MVPLGHSLSDDSLSPISSGSVDHSHQQNSPHSGSVNAGGGPMRRVTKKPYFWTKEEDDLLRHAVQLYNGRNWKKIAKFFSDRNDTQCRQHWHKVLNPDLIKGNWTKDEDDIIVTMVKKVGTKKWSLIAEQLVGRTDMQCRQRWLNKLNPEIRREVWTEEENDILAKAHAKFGNKWVEIAKFLPGRTSKSIMEHWTSMEARKRDTMRELEKLDAILGRKKPGSANGATSVSDFSQHQLQDPSNMRFTEVDTAPPPTPPQHHFSSGPAAQQWPYTTTLPMSVVAPSQWTMPSCNMQSANPLVGSWPPSYSNGSLAAHILRPTPRPMAMHRPGGMDVGGL
eukprot:jgi/Chlat1/1806/Chrsp135S02138